jgi:hypothetical protein
VTVWVYQLRLALANGRMEPVEFRLTELETFTAQKGDVVSTVYLMRGAERDSLLSVHNGTLGERVVIALPGEKAKKEAWMLAGGIGVVTIGVVAMATGMGLLGFGAGALAFVGAGFTLGHTLMPRVTISEDEKARLTSTQRMIAEKLELEEARARVVQGIESRAELRERLVSLRTKMERLGLDVYAPRIAAMNAGIAAIDQQVALEARLRDMYERSIAMLEIELESGAAVDAMDGLEAPHIAATFVELRDLEEQQRELGRQIAANAEVEGLLRGTS